ncbi:uncharacterized protein EI90DRAFT_3028334 [Cantharellus anzutake]|uniref:uncharacterized protein n=1 Tax=Cantharellus anzutake TaxID=1750568 RepID=UPI001904305C|nr:uncharacterized protein EI90DRAFT_3028334 [Cantharellus anzutake]KAF8344120.1 hypothetical protein EI90DRAFT_3028334 [Cantharellus anzutake]
MRVLGVSRGLRLTPRLTVCVVISFMTLSLSLSGFQMSRQQRPNGVEPLWLKLMTGKPLKAGGPPTLVTPRMFGDLLFPSPGRKAGDRWAYLDINQKTLSALLGCFEALNCGPNQDKIVLLQSFHFRGVLNGWVAGEDTWAKSTVCDRIPGLQCYALVIHSAGPNSIGLGSRSSRLHVPLHP